jgi:hypothetical protein
MERKKRHHVAKHDRKIKIVRLFFPHALSHGLLETTNTLSVQSRKISIPSQTALAPQPSAAGIPNVLSS